MTEAVALAQRMLDVHQPDTAPPPRYLTDGAGELRLNCIPGACRRCGSLLPWPCDAYRLAEAVLAELVEGGGDGDRDLGEAERRVPQ